MSFMTCAVCNGTTDDYDWMTGRKVETNPTCFDCFNEAVNAQCDEIERIAETGDMDALDNYFIQSSAQFGEFTELEASALVNANAEELDLVEACLGQKVGFWDEVVSSSLMIDETWVVGVVVKASPLAITVFANGQEHHFYTSAYGTWRFVK